jgi:hypothetical protein
MVPDLGGLTVMETLTAHVSSSTLVNHGTVTFTVSNQSISTVVDGNGNAAVLVVLPIGTAASPQAIGVSYFDAVGDLTASANAATAPWQPFNLFLPSIAAFNASVRTVSADILGMLLTFSYNAAGLLTEIDFGSLRLVLHYNAANQLVFVSF